jgi:hypothetical protein
MGAGGDPAPGDSAPGVPGAGGTQHRHWAFVLFLLPVAAVVFPAAYNHIHPELAGIPFFVWYQFTAVVFGAAVTGLVYVLRGTQRHVTRTHVPAPPRDPPAAD